MRRRAGHAAEYPCLSVSVADVCSEMIQTIVDERCRILAEIAIDVFVHWQDKSRVQGVTAGLASGEAQ